ncbi:hypothetical protein [Croceiramulus getboli]|nr:hypothetical protein P8624_06540 [Flavobacteriaceae bacterium YJPT1-3]
MGELIYNDLEYFLQSLISLRSAMNNQIKMYPVPDKIKFKRNSEVYKIVKFLIIEIMQDLDGANPDSLNLRKYQDDIRLLLRYFDEVTLGVEAKKKAKIVEEFYQTMLPTNG